MPALPPSQIAQVRVLVVDDHELVRYGTARLIESEPDLVVCGEAAGTRTALQLLQSAGFDLAIIDLTLQEGNGLDLVREISHSFPNVRMIVCSMHDEALYAFRVLRAGARGYVNKQEATKKLLMAIRKVLAGGVFVSQQLTQELLAQTAGISALDALQPQHRLSDRELQVYEFIGESLTVKQIAERLQISPKTVEFHRERLRNKLGLAGNRDLARHAAQWFREQSESGLI
ncbi:MAG: response regulator transcription factor [Planctomycetaceae bacterium]|nr:response regulator transcription factor [Planctomycetaceae bacterium]